MRFADYHERRTARPRRSTAIQLLGFSVSRPARRLAWIVPCDLNDHQPSSSGSGEGVVYKGCSGRSSSFSNQSINFPVVESSFFANRTVEIYVVRYPYLLAFKPNDASGCAR